MEFSSSSPDFLNTATIRRTNRVNGNIKMTDEKKQERVETISYLKLHLDLIAVILVITYTGFLLYKLKKASK
jgi:F0F1-type ATP synthase assembly protein I